MCAWKSVVDRILSCQERFFFLTTLRYIFHFHAAMFLSTGSNWAIDPSSMCRYFVRGHAAYAPNSAALHRHLELPQGAE